MGEQVTLCKIAQREQKRYQSKGFGLMVAAFINAIFFLIVPQIGYFVWPQMLEKIEQWNFTRWQVYFYGSMIWFWFNEVTSKLAMWIIYYLETDFFERYKVTEEPWPWKADPIAWNKLLVWSIKVIALNDFIVIPIAGYMLGSLVGFNVDFSFSEQDLPSSFTLLLSLIFCMICEDFAFHHLHKLLHYRSLYPHIHKWHHEYVQTVSLAAEVFHPLEFVLGGIIPVALGPILLGNRMHIFTYWVWSWMRTWETADGHSGYEFSWSPYRLVPFAASSEYHSFHHSHNLGNYSSFFSFWDTLYGTNVDYHDFYANKRKEEKQQFRKNKGNKKEKKKEKKG